MLFSFRSGTKASRGIHRSQCVHMTSSSDRFACHVSENADYRLLSGVQKVAHPCSLPSTPTECVCKPIRIAIRNSWHLITLLTMPLDPVSKFFDRRDPILSERLDIIDRMLMVKLQKGNPDLLMLARGDKELVQALKKIIASLVSISVSENMKKRKVITISSIVASPSQSQGRRPHPQGISCSQAIRRRPPRGACTSPENARGDR